ncbi:hypothetical protein [Sphingomonas oleivorans]|uniref:hypothetical protein n=1 Tax=Sphingomonas oleivorans TaxID=1735121 RepID=UPI0013FDE942|nr:hypothetical protein [Sphingomonas oleivorans]
MLGWDSWLVEHLCDPQNGEPSQSLGPWCDLIPTLDDTVPAIIGGAGDIRLTR